MARNKIAWRQRLEEAAACAADHKDPGMREHGDDISKALACINLLETACMDVLESNRLAEDLIKELQSARAQLPRERR